MRGLGRTVLLIVAALVVTVVLVWVEVVVSDAQLCLNYSSSYDEYRQLGAWAITREALARLSIRDLFFSLYAVLAIALARRRGLQIFALALLAVPLAWLLLGWGSRMHSCDRHGCTTCEVIGAWVFFIQLPLGSLLLLGLLVQRLFEAVWGTRASAPGS